MLFILKNPNEDPIKEGSYTKNEIWYSSHYRTSISALQIHENIKEHKGKNRQCKDFQIP